MAAVLAVELSVEPTVKLLSGGSTADRGQEYTPVTILELIGLKLTEGEESGDKAFEQDRTERFHEIQGQRPSSVGCGMQVAQSGIETSLMKLSDELVIEQGRGIANHGIDGVLRWAGASPFEREFCGKEGGPASEVDGGGQPLQPAKTFERCRLGKLTAEVIDPRQCLAERLG